MMCVVRLTSWSGAAQRAKAMQSVGADRSHAATVDEGVELRCSGIDNPSLVLGRRSLYSDLVRFDAMCRPFTKISPPTERLPPQLIRLVAHLATIPA